MTAWWGAREVGVRRIWSRCLSARRLNARQLLFDDGCDLLLDYGSNLFFLILTALKLYSLWHVGNYHDHLYDFYVCSRLGLHQYNLARCHDFTKSPRLSGFAPSYFPVVTTPHLSLHSLPSLNILSSSSALQSKRSTSHESFLLASPAGFLPTFVSSIN